MNIRFDRLLVLALFVAAAFMAVGCGSKDVDPDAKVDAPGYYNGPMKPKGGGAGGATEEGK